MYQKIKSHPHTREIYAEKLIQEGVLTKEQAESETNKYREALEKGDTVVELVPEERVKKTSLIDWKSYLDHDWSEEVDTGMDLDRLRELGRAVTAVPDDFKMQAQVAREYEMRRKMIAGELPLNWGCAETLAYATLLTAGYRVRLCGQDSGRGTFSHRHSVLHDSENGRLYVPLSQLEPEQKNIDIIDSVLSEEAVLAFEYGYATTSPNTLVIWEAQFGDFANGAQVVFDQFISSGEQKWRRLCGLTVYLPHGYEGQGPEHSSARLERYLQLCAENNMQVCVPSTPAQMFHMLRRQMLRPYRKPLIVLTPKSLLRHKLAVSSMDDLANGQFHLVIPEIDDLDADKVRKVVLCSGKVYYDLLQQRRDKKIQDVAVLRIEQLYPFPVEALKAELAKFKSAKEFVWCQEEPQNQGAWYSSRHHLDECVSSKEIIYVGRLASASPATGYTSLHLEQQQALVEEALK
jgi:2-oxoglutarate dehydrogenase E1 component